MRVLLPWSHPFSQPDFRVLLDLGKADARACNKNKQNPAALALKLVRGEGEETGRQQPHGLSRGYILT